MFKPKFLNPNPHNFNRILINYKPFILISYVITLIIVTFFLLFILGFLKYQVLAISSNSMAPTYKMGDLIIYQKLSTKELQNLPLNTIVIYKQDNRLIAHRIISLNKNKSHVVYLTKGDYNNATDTKVVFPEDILGIYRFKIKYLGYPTIYLKKIISYFLSFQIF